MAYSNWGENLANSFMSMYQANNQKKLETERMGLERDRLGLERQRTEDALKTNLLQRTQTEREMARREREDAYFLANQINLDMDKNPDNGKEFGVDARYAGLFNPYAYENYGVNTVGANGMVVNTPTYMQNYMAPSLLESAGQSLNANVTMREGDKNRETTLATTGMQLGATQANTAAIREETRLKRYRDASMVASNSISANGRYLTQAQKESLIFSISEGYGLSVKEATQIVESETNAFAGKQHSNGSQGGHVIEPTNGRYRNFNTPGGVQG